MHILHICTCKRYCCFQNVYWYQQMRFHFKHIKKNLIKKRRCTQAKTIDTYQKGLIKHTHVTKSANLRSTIEHHLFFWKQDIIKRRLHKKKASYSIKKMQGYESLTRIWASFDRRRVSMLCLCERHYTHVRGIHVSQMDGRMSIMSIWDTAVTCEISGTWQSCVYRHGSGVSGIRVQSCARY